MAVSIVFSLNTGLRSLRRKSKLTTALVLSGSISISLGLVACGGGGDASTSNATAAISAAQARIGTDAVTTAPLVSSATAPALTPALTAIQALGQDLFNDPNLSTPAGTACIACHSPRSGFSDLHGSTIGVALGSLPTSLGLRNPNMAAYSQHIPAFGFVTAPNGKLVPVGGQFWDGRADTLAEQALLPFLNPLEMNNASQAAVVAKVAAAPYASQFAKVFGAGALSNTSQAFTQVGQAIAAFEASNQFQAFTSKFDAVVTGQATFTAAEQRGLNLFLDPQGGNCAGCHKVDVTSNNPANSPFTNSGYFVEGIPRNTAIPDNANPSFFDLGLCGPERTPPTAPAGVNINNFCGAFKMQSLRNVSQRTNFMHNGFFTKLQDVVTFYSTRNSNAQHWYGPSGIPNDLPTQYLGNLETKIPPFNRPASAGPLFNAQQVSDLVTFLGTLSDGYLASTPTTVGPPNPPAPPAAP